MTTVLADARHGVVVADTGASDGDRQWPGARKVWRVRGALLAFCGEYEAFGQFRNWWRAGDPSTPLEFSTSSALVLNAAGLWLYAGSTMPYRVERGIEAIGTGAKAALAAYEALGRTDPRRAVQIACQFDAQSRAPVRSYRL